MLSITLLLWFLLLLLLLHAFFFIGDRSKNSFVKNPTELGGARRLWALTCKHLMVSAATPAFPYTSAGKKVRYSCRSLNCCWNESWIPSALHTKLPLLLVCERRCGRRCSPSGLQMTKTCNSLLCTANGSPCMLGGGTIPAQKAHRL